MNKKLTRCIQIAKCLQPTKQDGKNWHMTFIFDGARIISIGHNCYKHENLHYKFGKYLPTREGANYHACRHSECQAISKLKKTRKNLSFFNVRIDNNGKAAMSQPCKNCQREIDKLSPKKIIFTIDEKTFGTIS